MSAPASAPTRNGSSGDSLTESDLVEQGRRVLKHYHIAYTKRWLKWVAQQFLAFTTHATAYAFFQFLAAEVQLSDDQKREAESDPDLARIFAYREDPTGEDAVNHVMHQRGW